MKLKIAHDARPQIRTLLIATALSVALWFIPYVSILTYPFQLFVTFIHEGGHALAAILTGGSVRSLSVAMDTSGLTETYIAEGSLIARLFVSSAGYLSAMAYGALMLILVRRTIAARAVLAGSAALILALTLVFGLVVPLTYFSFSPFTIVSGVLISLGLLFAAKRANARTANFLVSFLAVQCVLNALFNLRDLLILSAGSDVRTDAGNMAAATGIPAIFWAMIWIGIAFLILSMALRAYAVNSGKTPSQPDLPFEDPLEV